MIQKNNIESVLDNPDLVETLPEDMGIAFHWIARDFGQSIGEKNIERVQKFAQLESQRTFYVVVHGLKDEQIEELNEQFNACHNVKVLKFNSLKSDKNQYDLHLVGYAEKRNNRAIKLEQYWSDIYSEKVKRRMHFSNEIDLMKYHLAIHSDQIVGVGNPLAVFDFDTLPVEGKKIGKVKIIKEGVLLAYLSEGVDKNARLDLPILAVSKEDNKILRAFQQGLLDDPTPNFFRESYIANTLISKIRCGNILNLLELIGISSASSDHPEMYDEIYEKANQLFAFNRNENVIIASDKSWHYSNYIKANNTSRKTDTVKQSTPNPIDSTTTQQEQPVDRATSPQKTPVSNENNNDLHKKHSTQSLPVVDNKIPNSPQKQASGISLRGWTIIGSALLFGAIGATLVAIGIIPEITAIGLIATAVLLGIVGAALGCIVGYLTDITVNKCCNSEMKAA